jgi:Lrp/AsnC family transcriptional regulator for asnA, asnC and gidA
MIDEIDRELILELQKDGRQSYIDLAKTLKVSETTVRNRVKQLIGDGMINITAIPNLEAMGYGFMGIVGLQVRLADLRTIASQIAKHPNVCYLANVTGRFDFILIVLTRTSGEFAEFMENAISAIPGILRTETFVNLHIYKGQVIGLDTGHLISKLDISSLKKQV